MAILTDIVHIVAGIILPVFVLIGCGVLTQRFEALDRRTLVTLNIYLLIPAYLFLRLQNSTFSYPELGLIGAAILGPMVIVAAVLFGSLRVFRVRPETIAAIIVASVFFNAANLGIPVAEAAFGKAGGEVQSLVMMFVNVSTFLAGYTLLAMGQGQGPRAVWAFLRLPYPYVIVIALAMRDFQIPLPTCLQWPLERMAAGMIPLALITFGAQLAGQLRWPRWRIVLPVIVFKLFVFPVCTAIIVWQLGMWPWPGAVLILASAAPPAFNTLLLTMKVDGDAETAADCIVWTTMISAVTIALVLALLRHLAAGQLPSV